MSGERPEAVHDPWPALKEEWAMHHALQDPKVLATFGLFAKHHFAQATKDFVMDDLERQIISRYGVPYDRVNEVFGQAETIIYQEMEADGEA